MNIRRRSVITTLDGEQIFTPLYQDDAFGAEPEYEPVGQPWRYEFPHQPSSSDPDSQPDFTVPVPGSESIPCSEVLPGPRLVSQTETQE